MNENFQLRGDTSASKSQECSKQSKRQVQKADEDQGSRCHGSRASGGGESGGRVWGSFMEDLLMIRRQRTQEISSCVTRGSGIAFLSGVRLPQ